MWYSGAMKRAITTLMLAATVAMGAGDAPNPAPQELTRRAEQGDADAQAKLGLQQFRQSDMQGAVQWLTKAAEQGQAVAQYNLGVLYLRGLGVPRNIDQAVALIRKAANQGDAQAQETVAIMCMAGVEGEGNAAEAVAWFQKAVDQGLATSQLKLALMYLEGQGVEKDVERGFSLLKAAAQQGLADAQFCLGAISVTGRYAEKNVEEGLEWLNHAAQQGNAEALFLLGVMYMKGEEVPKDMRKAMGWLEMASSQGHPNAAAFMSMAAQEMQNSLEAMYLKRIGVEKSPMQAVLWVETEAEKGNADATIVQALVELAENEQAGTPAKVAERLHQALDTGKASEIMASEARMMLSLMHLVGYGVEQNTTLAAELMQQAAIPANLKAQYFMSRLYELGLGVTQDKEACNRYKDAVDYSTRSRLKESFDLYLLAEGDDTQRYVTKKILSQDDHSKRELERMNDVENDED